MKILLFSIFFSLFVPFLNHGYSASPESRAGGSLKLQAGASFPKSDSYLTLADDDVCIDENAGFRFNHQLFFGEHLLFETHYEILYGRGDTRRKEQELSDRFPDRAGRYFFSDAAGDDGRLMDLTRTFHETDEEIISHRLDRLSLAWTSDLFSFRIGRQAVTWGNGLLFNPMDMFNPFAPTDFVRDYKTGDDMASLRFSVRESDELHFLYVPRRNTDGRLTENCSSIAGKYHYMGGGNEFDLMMAKHHRDLVFGIGGLGSSGGSTWRMDFLWHLPEGKAGQEDFVSFTANIDHSRTLFGKNVYGVVLFYYNGLGTDDYSRVFEDNELSHRIERKEIFVSGRLYAGAETQIELHPLFNLYFTAICNIEDPSGIFQPRGIWNLTGNGQLIMGADLYFGESGTEFGGISIPGTEVTTAPSRRIYLWYSYYF